MYRIINNSATRYPIVLKFSRLVRYEADNDWLNGQAQVSMQR